MRTEKTDRSRVLMCVKFLLLPTLLLLAITSCNRTERSGNVVFLDLGSNGMTPHAEYVFENLGNLTPDTLPPMNYDLSLVVRYNENCVLQELPLKMETLLNLNDSLRSMDINLPLFSAEGENLGKGAYGVYQREVKLFSDVPLDENFFLSVSTEAENTVGILSLGLRAM
ncbi:MAG: hypothetical protein J1F38_00955 [Muribaculaceae bacterium]|nr:hypothetical protein [Muribaculaceae bacterium]